MGATPKAIRFNVVLMQEDMASKGWLRKDLARRAKTTGMSVGRFFNGESQTPPMAKKLARALGHDVDRYLIRASEAVA